ncbi:hypothetical protein [Ramlibacter albus]|uniref:Uncharacterized protein n=1 Tax=Ramlibacter albus TaxID=2079448 RepID=A0A923MCV0_9BURK|nr:hypothetical protein [Ramlibacter albus]MBC5767650.1 hypothetical protein [Ramlibacter albus]
MDPVKRNLAAMGLPERFMDACLERFDVWRAGSRVSVFGAEGAPSDVVGVKLAKLVTPSPTWTLVTACHRQAAWNVHNWALSHFVPVQYVGSPAGRASRALATQLIAASDQVVVFERRREKRFDHVLQAAKQARKRVSLELYDVAGGSASQLSLA